MNITDISKRMKESDNRATAFPMFVVEQARRIYGVSSEYTETLAYVDADGDEISLSDCMDVEWSVAGYKDVYEFVTVFFSEQGAYDYIAANSHNLNSPRVFVYSGNRNREWQEVRSYLLEAIK